MTRLAPSVDCCCPSRIATNRGPTVAGLPCLHYPRRRAAGARYSESLTAAASGMLGWQPYRPDQNLRLRNIASLRGSKHRLIRRIGPTVAKLRSTKQTRTTGQHWRPAAALALRETDNKIRLVKGEERARSEFGTPLQTKSVPSADQPPTKPKNVTGKVRQPARTSLRRRAGVDFASLGAQVQWKATPALFPQPPPRSEFRRREPLRCDSLAPR